MYGLFLFLHTLVCVLLAGIILMQSGRGGGLTEAFASADSIFGAQTSSFLIKGTTVLASLFLISCLSLAFLSSKRSESIMAHKAKTQETQPEKTIKIDLPNESSEPVQQQTIEIPQEASEPVPQVPEAATSPQGQ